jgi:hypothetical protein
MKLAAVFSTTALAVLLGFSVPMYAQQDEPRSQEDRRAEPDGKAAHEQDRQDDKHVDQDKQGDHDRQAQPDREGDRDRRAAQDRDQDNRHGNQEENSARPEDRHEHQAEGRQGGHIPDDRFRANFGRQHTFSIGQPVIVEGTPRFQYSGYWFVIAQPWPVGWAYGDPVYIDYIDGEYFLLSPVHPGIQIAINVIL